MEFYLDNHSDGYGFPVLGGGFKAVLAESRKGARFQSVGEGLENANILWETLSVNNELKHANSLDPVAPSLIRVLRGDHINDLRRLDPVLARHKSADWRPTHLGKLRPNFSLGFPNKQRESIQICFAFSRGFGIESLINASREDCVQGIL